jgi:MFS family permease
LTATYLVNGILHVVSVGALLAMHFGAIELRRREPAWNSLVEGLGFIRKESIILALLATDMAAMLFGSYRVLLPIFAERLEVGPEGLGLLFSAPGVGSLLGAFIIMSLGDFRYKGLWIVAAILAYCGALVLLAVAPWFWLALLAAALTGATDSFQATPRNGVIQLVTPDALRGRVSSFQHMLVNGMPSLGQAIAGAAAALLTAPVSVVAGAGVCAAVVLGILASRKDLRAADLGSEPRYREAPVVAEVR